MAHTFDSLSLKGIRLAHLRQLAAYIEDRERDEWYYGDREQFEKRHSELRDWIDGAISFAESSDVKFPK